MTKDNNELDNLAQTELLAQPLDYVCIEPEKGEQVFDYFNGLLSSKEKREFENHLSLCLDCQEQLGKLYFLFNVRATAQSQPSTAQEHSAVNAAGQMRSAGGHG